MELRVKRPKGLIGRVVATAGTVAVAGLPAVFFQRTRSACDFPHWPAAGNFRIRLRVFQSANHGRSVDFETFGERIQTERLHFCDSFMFETFVGSSKKFRA